jgi:hypothetical protein
MPSAPVKMLLKDFQEAIEAAAAATTTTTTTKTTTIPTTSTVVSSPTSPVRVHSVFDDKELEEAIANFSVETPVHATVEHTAENGVSVVPVAVAVVPAGVLPSDVVPTSAVTTTTTSNKSTSPKLPVHKLQPGMFVFMTSLSHILTRYTSQLHYQQW